MSVWTGRRAGGGLTTGDLAVYVPAQIAGAICGSVLADAVFARPLVHFSTHDRSAGHLVLAEVVATAGLVCLILGLARTGRTHPAPVAVASWTPCPPPPAAPPQKAP